MDISPRRDKPASARLEELIRLSRRLVDRLASQVEADDAAFREAYRLGFASGVVVGREQLGNELAEADRRRAEYVNGVADRSPYAGAGAPALGRPPGGLRQAAAR